MEVDKTSLLIFRAEVKDDIEELERMQAYIVNQRKTGVIVLPHHVVLVDIKENDNGGIEIGYV